MTNTQFIKDRFIVIDEQLAGPEALRTPEAKALLKKYTIEIHRVTGRWPRTVRWWDKNQIVHDEPLKPLLQ